MRFSLRQMLEAIAWLTPALAFIGYVAKVPRSSGEDFGWFYMALATPFVMGSCLSMAIGALAGKRYIGLLVASIIAAIPTALFVINLVRMAK